MNKKWIIIGLTVIVLIIISIVLAFKLLKPKEAVPETPIPPVSSDEQQPPESSISDLHIQPSDDAPPSGGDSDRPAGWDDTFMDPSKPPVGPGMTQEEADAWNNAGGAPQGQ